MQLHYIPDRVELKFGFSKNVHKWKTFQTTLIEAKCQSLFPPPTPQQGFIFFCRVAKTLASDLEISDFLLLVTFVQIWNGFIGFRGFVWASTPVTESRGCAAALLQVRPSDNLASLCYQDPARKGEVVLVPPKLSQCPWHDACGSCLISHCWQLKHKHIVIFLDETVQTFQNSLCMQICMLSESTTHAHGIYGKCWEIWKEIVWEVVLFFWT